jgi:C2 domain
VFTSPSLAAVFNMSRASPAPPAGAAPQPITTRSKGAINISVNLSHIAAQGLVGLDIGHTSDPYVLLTLLSTDGAMTPVRRKTSVVRKTTAASWPENFSFELSVFSVKALQGLYFGFDVWDSNSMTADELIGSAAINLIDLATGPRSFTLGLLLPTSSSSGAASSMPSLAAFNTTALRGVLSFEAAVSQVSDAVAVVKDISVELQLEGSESAAAKLLASLELFSPASQPFAAHELGINNAFASPAPSAHPTTHGTAVRCPSSFHLTGGTKAKQDTDDDDSDLEPPTNVSGLLSSARAAQNPSALETALAPPRLTLEASFSFPFAIPGLAAELSAKPLPSPTVKPGDDEGGRETPCLLEYHLASVKEVKTGPNAVTLSDLYASSLVLRLARADTSQVLAESFIPISLLPLRNTNASNASLEVGVGSNKKTSSGGGGGSSGGGPPAHDDAMAFVAPLFLVAQPPETQPQADLGLKKKKRSSSGPKRHHVSKRSDASEEVKNYSDDEGCGPDADEGEDGKDDDDHDDQHLDGTPMRRTLGIIRGKVMLETAPILAQLVHGRYEQHRGCVDAVLLCDTLPFLPYRIWSFCGAPTHPSLSPTSSSPTAAVVTSISSAGTSGAASSTTTARPPSLSLAPSTTPSSASSGAAAIAAVLMPVPTGPAPSTYQKPTVLYGAGKGIVFKGGENCASIVAGAAGGGAVTVVNPAAVALRSLSGKGAGGPSSSPGGGALVVPEMPWEWSLCSVTFS